MKRQVKRAVAAATLVSRQFDSQLPLVTRVKNYVAKNAIRDK
jgi:hypothetical protein